MPFPSNRLRGGGVQTVDFHTPPIRPWNPNVTLARNANDAITKVTLDQAGFTFERTINRDVDDLITSIDPWVEV